MKEIELNVRTAWGDFKRRFNTYDGFQTIIAIIESDLEVTEEPGYRYVLAKEWELYDYPRILMCEEDKIKDGDTVYIIKVPTRWPSG